MTLGLWCLLPGLLFGGEGLAASLRIPSAKAHTPKGVFKASARKAKTDPQWIVGDSGQSCSAACDAIEGAESATCSEERIKYLDTEAKLLNIAVDGGIACDTGQGFGWSEFPKLDESNSQCSFRRPFTYTASCANPTVPQSHRFCSCSGTWYRSALGQSCSGACADNGGLTCEELPLEECITEECVVALGNQLGFPCSSATIYAKEFPSQLPNMQCAYTYGYQERCEDTVTPNERRFCPCDVVLADGNDAVGEGDPHMTNIYGEKFDINFVGVHSMIRIPGYGPAAGKVFELSARVSDFGHLKPIAHCDPYYFDMFDLRGELLGGAVRHMEVLRDSASGVSFSSIMSDGGQSLLDQNLTVSATLKDGAVFGSVAVRHRTRQRKDLLVLRIQADPPVEVTVNWWNSKPGQPGLNLRVHGLRPEMGAVGGFMGLDPHSNISSDPGIRGCPPRARADGPKTVAANITAGRRGDWMMGRLGMFPDLVIH